MFCKNVAKHRGDRTRNWPGDFERSKLDFYMWFPGDNLQSTIIYNKQANKLLRKDFEKYVPLHKIHLSGDRTLNRPVV